MAHSQQGFSASFRRKTLCFKALEREKIFSDLPKIAPICPFRTGFYANRYANRATKTPPKSVEIGGVSLVMGYRPIYAPLSEKSRAIPS
jgi:hypothetical protein